MNQKIDKFLFFLFYQYILNKRDDIDFLVLYPESSLNIDFKLTGFEIAGLIANFCFFLFDYSQYKDNYKNIPHLNIPEFFDMNTFILDENLLCRIYDKIKNKEKVLILDIIYLFKYSLAKIIKKRNLNKLLIQ